MVFEHGVLILTMCVCSENSGKKKASAKLFVNSKHKLLVKLFESAHSLINNINMAIFLLQIQDLKCNLL